MTYSLTLKMEQHIPPKRHLAFNGPHGIISHKTETLADSNSGDAEFKSRHVDRVFCQEFFHDFPQTCDSPNLLQFSRDAIVFFSHFGSVTGLLANYDLFFVSGQKKLPCFCLHSF
jgi:hypothetical protein